ncbi:MAG: Cof-type HAD-IIB family hydrolase [Phocaeicola sp.]
MKYKLLALDLDGTLTDKQKEITPHTLHTLLRAQEMGVKIVLASGRPTYGIAPLAEKLKLKEHGGYILSYNGCEIFDWSNGKLLYKKTLNTQLLPYLHECATKNNFAILQYEEGCIVTEMPEDSYVLQAARLNKMSIRRVENLLEEIKTPMPKWLIAGEPKRLERLEKEMSNALKGKMGIFRSEPYFLELVPDGVDKALSLALLLEKIGMRSEETIAIGDGFNDLSMIQYAGLGIAMGNAQPIVKENADYITLSNDQDGVAAAIEKFIFAS